MKIGCVDVMRYPSMKPNNIPLVRIYMEGEVLDETENLEGIDNCFEVLGELSGAV
jgi:hypothetical protein